MRDEIVMSYLPETMIRYGLILHNQDFSILTRREGLRHTGRVIFSICVNHAWARLKCMKISENVSHQGLSIAEIPLNLNIFWIVASYLPFKIWLVSPPVASGAMRRICITTLALPLNQLNHFMSKLGVIDVCAPDWWQVLRQTNFFFCPLFIHFEYP